MSDWLSLESKVHIQQDLEEEIESRLKDIVVRLKIDGEEQQIDNQIYEDGEIVVSCWSPLGEVK